jgi:hypothetical protein
MDWRIKMLCPLCKQTIDKDDPTNWNEVKGWVGGPKQDSMRLRSDTGEFAHAACVLALADGQVPGAADLFEAPQDPEPVRTHFPDRDDPINDFFPEGL